MRAAKGRVERNGLERAQAVRGVEHLELVRRREPVTRLDLERRRAVREHGREARQRELDQRVDARRPRGAQVERMPPPAAAISRYVAPLARSAYSSSREPAKIRWLGESTKPGSPTPPPASSRRAPSAAATSASRRDSGPTHTMRPP